MTATLVAGVIVAGVGSNANPHALASHTDVALSAPTDGDVIRFTVRSGKPFSISSSIPVIPVGTLSIYITLSQNMHSLIILFHSPSIEMLSSINNISFLQSRIVLIS